MKKCLLYILKVFKKSLTFSKIWNETIQWNQKGSDFENPEFTIQWISVQPIS